MSSSSCSLFRSSPFRVTGRELASRLIHRVSKHRRTSARARVERGTERERDEATPPPRRRRRRRPPSRQTAGCFAVFASLSRVLLDGCPLPRRGTANQHRRRFAAGRRARSRPKHSAEIEPVFSSSSCCCQHDEQLSLFSLSLFHSLTSILGHLSLSLFSFSFSPPSLRELAKTGAGARSRGGKGKGNREEEALLFVCFS